MTGLTTALEAQKDRLLPCVHCGFCLPACPTYVRLGDENDSPRGRLHLMRAVVEGRLSAGSDAFQTHIDRCLGCRACEPVCPSGVEYGLLLERAREVAFQARKPRPSTRVLLAVFRRRFWLRWGMRLARTARGLGLAWLGARLTPAVRMLHPLRFGFAMLAASRGPGLSSLPTRASADSAPALPAGDAPAGGGAGPVAGDRPLRIALLTGCVQAGLFARVNNATVRVLQANGFEIVPVEGQRCCGALHAHAGDAESARELARGNVDAFARAEVDLVAVNAAGCGAALKEYGHLLAADGEYAEAASRLAESTRDVSELLVVRGARRGAPLPLRVTYDAACHLCHAQRLRQAPRAMLASIPELDLVPLRGEEECCGGAGIYGLTHAELGERIGSDKVAAVVDTGADMVVTANTGCIMQIGAGLLLRGSRVTVRHPVELLDESYRRAGFYG